MKTLPRRWLRRCCGVRLSLRGAGGGRPQAEWFAAAPAVRRPTGRRMVGRRFPRPDRCCDGERWAAVAATSPGLYPAARVMAVASEAVAATSPVPATRIRRCRDRSTPWSDVIVHDGRAHSSRLRVHRSGLAPLRRRRWNAVLEARPAASTSTGVRRRSASGAKACRVTAHYRRPTTPRRSSRPDRNSSGCRVLRRAPTVPPN